MVGLTVMLLGGFEARLASGAPLNLPTKKAQALLAYLAVRPGQSHPRDKLAALLWGEKSDDQARGGLRHALVALRRALADADPPSLRIEGQTVAVNPAGVEVDVVTFERRVAEGTPAGAGAGGRAVPRRPAPGLHRERAALRGVARRRAGAAAGDGAGGPGAAAGPSEQGRGHRARHSDGGAAARARSPAGGGAPHAHAALRPPGAAGSRAQAVPGVRGRAAAGAGDRARGGDEAALSGAASAPGRGGAGSRRSRRTHLVAPREGRSGSTRSPRGGDAAVRAAGGTGAFARAARRGHAGARTRRHRGGRGGHRQDAARQHAGGRRACPRMPGADRPLPRERLDPPLRALGRRLPQRRGQRRRGDPRRPAPDTAGRVDPPAARGGHGRPAAGERQRAAPVRERGRADRAGRRPPAAGPRAGGRALGRRDESPPAGLREPPHSGVDGAPGRHRARGRARRCARWLGEPWRTCPARPTATPVALSPLSRPDTALLVRALARGRERRPDGGPRGGAGLGHERGQSLRRRGGDARPRSGSPVGWRSR